MMLKILFDYARIFIMKKVPMTGWPSSQHLEIGSPEQIGREVRL